MTQCKACGGEFEWPSMKGIHAKQSSFSVQVPCCPFCGQELYQYSRDLAAKRMTQQLLDKRKEARELES